VHLALHTVQANAKHAPRLALYNTRCTHFTTTPAHKAHLPPSAPGHALMHSSQWTHPNTLMHAARHCPLKGGRFVSKPPVGFACSDWLQRSPATGLTDNFSMDTLSPHLPMPCRSQRSHTAAWQGCPPSMHSVRAHMLEAAQLQSRSWQQASVGAHNYPNTDTHTHAHAGLRNVYFSPCTGAAAAH